MRMGRAHHRAIDLAGEIKVVAVTAVAGNEAQVFLASYRRSDACVHDGEEY